MPKAEMSPPDATPQRWRLAPASLTLQLFLLLLCGVVLAAAITFAVTQRERREVVEHFRGQEALQRISDMVRLLETQTPAQRQATAERLGGREWQLRPGPPPGSGDPDDPDNPDDRGHHARHFASQLNERLQGQTQVTGVWRLRPGGDAMERSGRHVRPRWLIGVRFADGEEMHLHLNSPRRLPPPIEEGRVPYVLLLFISLVALVTWFAVRLAVRPLRRLAQAAEGFGRDLNHPPLATGGPNEVRLAAEAFNRMQERIRRYMAERTQILAAVTHDLKTPLTRMRLRLESCDDEALRSRLENDLGSMQRLVDEGLELARSMDSTEALSTVDLASVAQSLCEDAADAGLPARYQGPETGQAGQDGPLLVLARPRALQRALQNLIDNALTHGGDAEVSLARAGETVCLCIRDHGPGIPAEHLDAVLRPFFRLEDSRSRDTGGTGLGLSIANNLLTAMGARLSLSNAAGGGLLVSVTLTSAQPVLR